MCEKLTHYVWQAASAPAPSDDRITMLLTAVGVIVAAAGLMLVILSIGLAILAFYGKREIIEAAEKKAEKAAMVHIEKFATPEALYSWYALKNKESTLPKDAQTAVIEDVEPPSEAPEVTGEQVAQPAKQVNPQPAGEPAEVAQERQGGDARPDRQADADDQLE